MAFWGIYLYIFGMVLNGTMIFNCKLLIGLFSTSVIRTQIFIGSNLFLNVNVWVALVTKNNVENYLICHVSLFLHFGKWAVFYSYFKEGLKPCTIRL